jgi:hypothetical protein
VARALLAEIGLDPGWVDAAISDPTTTDEVRQEHEKVTSRGGFGVPTLIFEDDQAIFGPVLIDPPTGWAAVRLWENIVGWLEFPHLYEIRRPKTNQDLAEIAQAFQPYLEARDWASVQHEAP